jgi:single-strand DNA-binding protein
MNTLKNKVQLIGNLGMDPDVKDLEGGKKVARFSLATKESYKNSGGEKVTDTQWHNIIAWGNNAKFAEKYLRKGQEIALEGKLTHRTYDDKDGVRRYFTEVVASEIQMLRGNANKE